MSSWKPTIVDTDAPKFLAIVDALQRDIASGTMPAGTRLPPYRELAADLGVSPGTVNKAYLEAQRRGLVNGTVGRGTFVGPAPALTVPDPVHKDAASADQDGEPAVIDLSVNTPPSLSHNMVLAQAFAEVASREETHAHSRYLPYFSHPEHRQAAVAWLRKHGVSVSSEQVIATNGAQHAMMVAISAVARRGDVVYTDRYTYPGILSLASYLGLQLVGIESDGLGMLPDRLDKAARAQPGKAVYLMPTLQNPTARTMDLDRRRAIADVASRHGLFIIEDDIYGLLQPTGLPTLREIAPEACFYLTSMSKSVIPSLRAGFLVPPAAHMTAVEAAMRATGWTAAPLMIDVAAQLILDGRAERMAAENRREALARQTLAHQLLGKWLLSEAAACYHAWLGIPPGWQAQNLVAAARSAGVILTPPEGVQVGPGAPEGVRLCLGAARNLATLRIALERMVSVLSGTMRPAFLDLV